MTKKKTMMRMKKKTRSRRRYREKKPFGERIILALYSILYVIFLIMGIVSFVLGLKSPEYRKEVDRSLKSISSEGLYESLEETKIINYE